MSTHVRAPSPTLSPTDPVPRGPTDPVPRAYSPVADSGQAAAGRKELAEQKRCQTQDVPRPGPCSERSAGGALCARSKAVAHMVRPARARQARHRPLASAQRPRPSSPQSSSVSPSSSSAFSSSFSVYSVSSVLCRLGGRSSTVASKASWTLGSVCAATAPHRHQLYLIATTLAASAPFPLLPLSPSVPL